MKRTRIRRRVAVVTGTRAEYGVLRSILAAIDAHPRLSLQLIVTGMHLLPKFGRTLTDIRRDGWPVFARVPMQRGDDSPADHAEGLARGVRGIARALQRGRADIVLVLGDRIEALAGALAAVTTGRVLAHVHGGDRAPGDFDDSLRHAISKLAHLHLAATPASARRLIRMGEDATRVHVAGPPGLDDLAEVLAGAPMRRARTGRALVLFHATGRPATVERRAMTAILTAVRRAGLHPVVIYPNTDAGHSGVIGALEAYTRQHGTYAAEVHRSLPRAQFLRLLFDVDVMIGNSSAGLLEAPAAGIPVVDVGQRQHGREALGPVTRCTEQPTDIAKALRRALASRPRRPHLRTVGLSAGARVAAILATTPLNGAVRRKLIAY